MALKPRTSRRAPPARARPPPRGRRSRPGDPLRGPGDQAHGHDDPAPDVDAVEGVEQGRQRDAERRGDHRPPHGAVGLGLARVGVVAQPGAHGAELGAHVVDAALAVAVGDEPARLRGRPPLGRDDRVDPVRHVGVDVGEEPAELCALVAGRDALADRPLLAGQRGARGLERLEELLAARDHEPAHARLGVDHALLEVRHALDRAEDLVRALVGVVGRADRADEQEEHDRLEQAEDDAGDRDLAGERAGVALGGAHRGRS